MRYVEGTKFGKVSVDFRVADREGSLVDVVNIHRCDRDVLAAQIDIGDLNISDITDDWVREALL